MAVSFHTNNCRCSSSIIITVIEDEQEVKEVDRAVPVNIVLGVACIRCPAATKLASDVIDCTVAIDIVLGVVFLRRWLPRHRCRFPYSHPRLQSYWVRLSLQRRS